MDPRDMASSGRGRSSLRRSAARCPGFQPCSGDRTSQRTEPPQLRLLPLCRPLKQRASDCERPLPEAPPPVPEALPGGRVPRELRPAALAGSPLERLIFLRLGCRPQVTRTRSGARRQPESGPNGGQHRPAPREKSVEGKATPRGGEGPLMTN